MNLSSPPLAALGQRSFWLAVLAAAVASVYLGLLWRIQDVAHLGMSGLFLMAVASLVWDRRRDITLTSDRLSLVVGSVLIGGVLVYSNYLVSLDHQHFSTEVINVHWFLNRLAPVVSLTGVAIVAAGWQKIQQFWRELAIVAAMGIPSVMATEFTDISPITARFSSFLLWYGGIETTLRDHIYISIRITPTIEGHVKVYEACSGLETMTYLFGLSIVCLIMFPLRSSRVLRWLVPPMALVMGFVINSFRVVLMTLLVAAQNKEAFDYWHDGTGSLSFGLVAVMALGCTYMAIMQWDDNRWLAAKRKAQALQDAPPAPMVPQGDYLLPPDLEISWDNLDNLPPDLTLPPRS